MAESPGRFAQYRERFLQRIVRLKLYDKETISNTELKRCLNAFDLTALGVGSTLGTGIYVVTGQVARQTAGPGVIVAFAIAAFASILAGLCYAEFGARVPKTGSAYVFSYVTVGELVAFIIGWNLILEYVIGTASVARAWSENFDSLLGNKISHYFLNHTPMDVPGLAKYPDFFSLLITLLLTGVLAFGVKESSIVNNIFTTVNLMVVAFVIGAGFFYANIHNWELPRSEIPNPAKDGDGGFFPFGFAGLVSGAATCFYAFVGFDAIATTGEEVVNPQKVIPRSIVLSLVICFIAYGSVSAVITLMCPYYLIDPKVPLPQVFAYNHLPSAHYVISVGAVCGLSTSLLGAMFPLPRVVYAMASDGLLFRFLANVNQRYKTPLIATVVSGLLAGLMAMMFDLAELVNMMSIGTLLAYTLVAVCVLILRYQPDSYTDGSSDEDIRPIDSSFATDNKADASINGIDAEHERSDVRVDAAHALLQNNHSLNPDDAYPGPSDEYHLIEKRLPEPTVRSGRLVIISISVIGAAVLSFNAIIVFGMDHLAKKAWWAILLLCIFGVTIIALTILIYKQPQNTKELSFKVKFLPFLPVFSVFVNLFLMLKLPYQTWIRFGVWMAIGFVIYFGYGMWYSKEERQIKGKISRVTINHGPVHL